MRKAIVFLISGFLVAACAAKSPPDHEDDSWLPGKEFILKTRVLICKDVPVKTEQGMLIEYKLVYDAKSPLTRCRAGETIVLGEGGKIQVTDVVEHVIYGPQTMRHLYLIGRSAFPDGRVFDFYYLYGFESGQHSYREKNLPFSPVDHVSSSGAE